MRCFVPDGASRTTASGLIVRGAPSWRKGFRALQGKVNGFCLVPRVFDCTMVEPSETEPSLETRPHGFRLSPIHLTATVRRQILRGLIVVAIFITFVAVLAAIFGLSIQNGINAVASTDQWLYSIPVVGDVPIVPGLGINWIRDVTTFAVGFSFMASVHVLLKYTNLGKAMRATADNLELAKATGIDTKRVTYAAWAISCGFASTSGVLLGLIGVVSPQMGIQYLLLVFAAVIVGGIGSAYGAMLGGLVVGLSQEMVVPLLVWLGEPDVIGLPHADAYKVTVPFMILIAVLLFRPSGIAGRQTAIVPRGVVTGAIAKALAARRAPIGPPGSDQKGG